MVSLINRNGEENFHVQRSKWMIEVEEEGEKVRLRSKKWVLAAIHRYTHIKNEDGQTNVTCTVRERKFLLLCFPSTHSVWCDFLRAFKLTANAFVFSFSINISVMCNKEKFPWLFQATFWILT